MTVRSMHEAWAKVDEIFPSDYIEDENASARAGYPVYRSTLEGCDNTICDLGSRLEVNIYEKGKRPETINIWVDDVPEIKVTEKWSAYEVRNMCVKHDYYTAGDCRAYDKMLNFVGENEPTLENLYKVAKDIFEHSDNTYIESVMFDLRREAVTTFYDIV